MSVESGGGGTGRPPLIDCRLDRAMETDTADLPDQRSRSECTSETLTPKESIQRSSSADNRQSCEYTPSDTGPFFVYIECTDESRNAGRIHPMVIGMWLITTILFIAILGLLAYFDTKKPKNYPPGPNWLPILGSAWAIHKLRQQTGSLCKSTATLAAKYGPVVGLRVGTDRTVVVYGSEAIREFLMQDDLSGRPKGIFYRTRTWGMRRGVLLTDEDFWQEQRRFVLRHLRDFGFGKRNMSDLIEEEAAVMIADLKQKIADGKGSCVVRMDDLFGIHVLNTLWVMMAGVRYSPEDKHLRTLQKILTELLANIDIVGTLFSHFPFLRHIAPEFSGYNMFLKTHQRLWKFLNDELQKHKQSYNPFELRDFMDVYLKMLNSPEKKDSFSEMQLLAICLDLFVAGSETTSKTLGFGFLYLLLNPDVQTQAQEEIDRVIGRHRLPTMNDRPNMQYTESVALESIRMFAKRGFTVPHRALKDTTLQGYFIPKDTQVTANLQGALGEESEWAKPEAFMPERFIKDGHTYTPDTFFPFGVGRHRCMGETLARANIFLIIASLLQNFNFSNPPGCPLPSTEEIDGATPGPQPFQALVTLR